MKKKKNKLITSIFSVLGVIALFLVVGSTTSLIYKTISINPLKYLIIGFITLVVLIVLGGISWKKVKKKLKDIFT